jgi:hypothetical protein
LKSLLDSSSRDFCFQKKLKLASKLFLEAKISSVTQERSRISKACHLPNKDHRDDEGGEG